MNKSIDNNLENIVKFLWMLIIVLVVGFLFVGGNVVRSAMRNHKVGDEAFSSANLDRISRGVYRLRCEVFGDRTDPRREGTPLDFDRDLELTIHVENGLLSFNIMNRNEDIVITRTVLRGRLRNRSTDTFNLINVQNIDLDLGYNESCNGIPISIYTTNAYGERHYQNWRWLTDLEEFSENFELAFLEIDFYWNTNPDGIIVLRYSASRDAYIIQSGAEFLDPY